MTMLLFTWAVIPLLFPSTILMTATEYGCLYGWQLSADKTTCFIHCLGVAENYCNLNVLKSANITYNSSDNTLSMPTGIKFSKKESDRLPSCYNLTLKRNHYKITANNLLDMGTNYFEIANYELSPNGDVTFCYPLTPQLLQCDTDVTDDSRYYIVNGTELRIPSKNVTAYVGDFYIMENLSAVTCTQNANINHVQFSKVPRCNYLTLSFNDVIYLNTSDMMVTTANYTIKHPVYSIIIDQIIYVCYPLSLDMGNCAKLIESVQYYYIVESSFDVYNIEYYATLTPDKYYITKERVLVFCNYSSKKKLNSTLIYDVYGYTGYVAVALLIFTIMIRYTFFVQNYHCICLLCHIVSLAFVYITFSTRKIFLNIDTVSCYITFAVDYYCMMSTYAWLSIISYDSWRYFSRLQTTTQYFQCCQCSFRICPKSADKSLQRFIVYNVFAWGLPTILITIVLTLNLTVKPCDFHTKFRPFILPGCFFNNIETFAIYYFIPESLFTVITIVFLILTIRDIRKASRGTELVNQRRRGQIFRVSLKMIIVMGICWPINFVFYFSSIFNPDLIRLWYGATGVTIVQGFVISLIYCARNETLVALKMIWNKIKGIVIK